MNALLKKTFRKSSYPSQTHDPAPRAKRFSLFSRHGSSAPSQELIPQDTHSASTSQPQYSTHSTVSVSQASSSRPTTSNVMEQSFKRIAKHRGTNEQDLVWRGIQYHESNDLERSTRCWYQAASSDIPLGHYFYGMALRHGWGCKKAPREAVKHFQQAAECAIFDLQTGYSKTSPAVAKSELVIVIYELGMCFQQGWGIRKNPKAAAHYFEVAANLGDADAQNALAFCYQHGEGVKKDKYRAAKYYRLADRQGAGLVGNSWVWKDKYDNEPFQSKHS